MLADMKDCDPMDRRGHRGSTRSRSVTSPSNRFSIYLSSVPPKRRKSREQSPSPHSGTVRRYESRCRTVSGSISTRRLSYRARSSSIGRSVSFRCFSPASARAWAQSTSRRGVTCSVISCGWWSANPSCDGSNFSSKGSRSHWTESRPRDASGSTRVCVRVCRGHCSPASTFLSVSLALANGPASRRRPFGWARSRAISSMVISRPWNARLCAKHAKGHK